MQRLNPGKASPEAYRALIALETYVKGCGIEPSLFHLIKLRASQLNGCAFCVNMHADEARADGETERRLQNLVTWEEGPFFTERERAALAWTEALTLLPQSHAPDEVYGAFAAQFSEKEQVDISLIIGTINAWNRIGVGFRLTPTS